MKRKKLVLPAVIGLALLLAVAVGWWCTARNNGRISNGSPSAASAAPVIRAYHDQYASFQYLGVYDAKQYTPRGGDLVDVYFSANVNYQKSLAYAVMPMPEGGLSNLSAQRLRQTQPQNYSGTAINVDGQPAELWKRFDGTEITILMPRGNKVGSLSFTASGTLDNLQAEVNQLLSTFKWSQ